MTCTRVPKIQAIFRIFCPISSNFRGYCKTLSTKTRIVTIRGLKIFCTDISYCKTLSTKTRIVTLTGSVLRKCLTLLQNIVH